MGRVFVRHDGTGRILGVAAVDVMADELPHPFHVAEGAHAVIEIPEADDALRDGLERLAETHVVDVAAATLVPKPRRGSSGGRKRKTPSRRGPGERDG